MNDQFKAQITYKAREFATAYTNRHFPNEPAFAFGHEGWAKFVVAMVELAGAHPDKGTSALAIEYIAKQWDGCRYDIVGEGFVDIGECIREAGTKFPQAAPVVPAPVAIPACIHVTEAMHRAAVKVLHRAHGLDGLPQRMMDAMLAAKAPQAAPVAQLSELPKLAFDESHIDYIDRYGGFCRDCADEDGVCPSSGLPCGGSKKAIRHVLTALAYGVNHGYIPVILCAAPTTPKDSE